MERESVKWHIICERDVGLFSLIQQVISHIPLAISKRRIPVAFWGDGCCYWTASGYMGADNVWEYYFDPIVVDNPLHTISKESLGDIRRMPPKSDTPGYYIGDMFVSSHFGDHFAFKNKTLKIPYKWTDPSKNLRQKASQIIREYIRPRSYIAKKVDDFYTQNMKDRFVIGVHMRATDVTDINEHNIHRRGSYNFERFVDKISIQLSRYPNAKLFVATDSLSALQKLKEEFGHLILQTSSIFQISAEVVGTGPTGNIIPGYLATCSQRAAENGMEAVVDYLLLSKCSYLIHNGSGLARTALLNNPELQHTNIHGVSNYLKTLLNLGNFEWAHFIRLTVLRYFYFLIRIKSNLLGK